MHGVTDASQIEERLVIYEKIRRNRAASIQVLSNFGYDESHETIAKELSGLLEGRAVPSEYFHFELECLTNKRYSKLK